MDRLLDELLRRVRNRLLLASGPLRDGSSQRTCQDPSFSQSEVAATYTGAGSRPKTAPCADVSRLSNSRAPEACSLL